MEQCDLLLEYLRQQKEKAYELLYHDYYVPLVLFADSVREKSEASGSIVGNSKIGSVSAKDMTMVEYKRYSKITAFIVWAIFIITEIE